MAIHLLTTADTEILATATAAASLPEDFPAVRAANPAAAADPVALADRTADGARVVVIRLLGGLRAWEEGFERLASACAERRVPLIALGGEAEPDAELAERSTAPPAVVAQAHEYLRHGGVENTAQLLRFLGDTLLLRGDGFEDPAPLPDHAAWDPEAGDLPVADALERARRTAAVAVPERPAAGGISSTAVLPAAERPVVGVVFYRSHRTSGNTDFVLALADAVREAGGVPLPVWCSSLRPDPDGTIPVLDALQPDGPGSVHPPRPLVDALLTTVLASGGSTGADSRVTDGEGASEAWAGWDVERLEALGVPVIQAAAATQSRERWADSPQGLTPLDVAMQVAIPEFDGRILGGVVSFKERVAPGATEQDARFASLDGEGAIVRYAPDRERCARVAGLAVRHARLRRLPAADRRIGIVLSSSPTKHSRIGNAVGLDTPASAVVLLRALAAEGQRVDASEVPLLAEALAADDVSPAEATAAGEALIHALVRRGGHDPELLTDDHLVANPHRLSGPDYAAWFRTLPDGLRALVERDHGPGWVAEDPARPLRGRWVVGGRAAEKLEAAGLSPADEVPAYVDGDDVVVAGIELGDVFVAIQPPRATSEEDAAALSHDPERAAPHHYFAVYRWLEATWGADALVHLGKHGTLEWLPGKAIGLSGDCHPDAILGSVPLVYPFVVNDPGEGVQSKRRVHATIVDHLVPPMMRAETYDELQELEHLLDEYVRVEALDPEKLPGLARRIWEVVESADLQHDLGFEEAPDLDHLDHLIADIDTYVCSIKDVQVRDGLHVLGRVPEEEQLRGLAVAILRLGSGDLPGLRVAVGRAFGLDEPALLVAGGARLPTTAAGDGGTDGRPSADDPDVAALVDRFPGPAATAGDLVDRLDEAQRALVDALGDADWPTTELRSLVTGVLGRGHGETERVLAYAASEVVPRIRRSTDEIGSVLGALAGRYVPSGASGSPTRGRLDVLPTGRNFYGVDPKALPSELSWEIGRRLADDLVRRHVEEEGRAPEQIGIVVWGTANMRTHGDDIAEILALLGVEPEWHRETRRVTGLRVIPLEELGRPRVDVTVRISGFFRDAFPALITMIDDAVALVAGLDEPDDRNPIRRHAREDEDRLVAELEEQASATHPGDLPDDGVDRSDPAAVRAAARRRATTRVFGSKPGTYGAGLLELVDSRSWRDRSDLAAVYESWGGYAYGRGLDGAESRGSMREQFARIEVAVKNLDTREHDLFDSDGYFQYHGGMVAMVEAITGSEPKAWLGDSADPTTVETRSLAEEARRVVRSRVLNPRWVAGMIRHGYKGAMELSVTVDYLFGYDATAGVVEDWMYERVTDRYVGDPDVRSFLSRSSPWALRQIAERLLEAADRGLWAEPDPERLETLRDVLLEVEGEVEEAGQA